MKTVCPALRPFFYLLFSPKYTSDLRYSYGVEAKLEWLSMLACRGAGAIALWNDLSIGCRGSKTPFWGLHSLHPGPLSLMHLIMGLLVQWACPLWLLSHIPNLTMKRLQIPTGIPEILVSLALVMNPIGFVSFPPTRPSTKVADSQNLDIREDSHNSVPNARALKSPSTCILRNEVLSGYLTVSKRIEV